MMIRPDTIKRLHRSAKRSDQLFKTAGPISASYGIAGNTFRAFRNAGVPPSIVYRRWAKEDGFNIIRTHKGNSRNAFLTMHEKLSSSFSRFWNLLAVRELHFHEKMKVIDLFLKAVAFSCGHPAEDYRRSIYQYGNIPLDKFSLMEIKKSFFGIH